MQSKRSIDRLTKAREAIPTGLPQQKDTKSSRKPQQQDLRNRQENSLSRSPFLAIPRLTIKITQPNNPLRRTSSPKIRTPPQGKRLTDKINRIPKEQSPPNNHQVKIQIQNVESIQ